jgi:hypothetical protein
MKHNIRLIALYYEGDNVGSSIQIDTSVLGITKQYNYTIYPGHAISPDVEIYEVEAGGSTTKPISIGVQASEPNSPIIVSHSDSVTLTNDVGIKNISFAFTTEETIPKNGTLHLTFSHWIGDPSPRDFAKEFESIANCICSIAQLESLLSGDGDPSTLSLYSQLNSDYLQNLFDAANALATHLGYDGQRTYYAGSSPCENTGSLLALIQFISLYQSRTTNNTLLTDFTTTFDTYKDILEQLKTILNDASFNPCGNPASPPNWPGIEVLGEDFAPTASCICNIFAAYASLSTPNKQAVDLLEQKLNSYFIQLQTFLASNGIVYNLSENYPCAKTGDISKMLGIIAVNYAEWDAIPGDYEELKARLREIKSLFSEITYLLPNICDGTYTGGGIDFKNAVLQSPYIYIQACGADNAGQSTGIIEGIHLRWSLLKEIGENHIPKGTLANTGSSYYTNIGYNKDNDFVKIYKTPYINPVQIELDFSTLVPQNVYTDNGRRWEIFTSTTVSSRTYNNTVVIKFLDESLYDGISFNPVTETFDFIKDYSGVLEIEVAGKMMFASEFEIQKSASNPATLLYETIRISDPSDANTLQVTSRIILSGDPINERKVGENIKSFKLKYAEGYPSIIKLETYEDFILSRSSWTHVDDFGLTLTDVDATARLDCGNPSSIDNLWPRFNDGLTTKLSNYEDKWSDTYGIKYGVTEYLTNSVSDTKATVILDSDVTGDTSKIEVSYLDYLNLAGLDYHIARMLGLGHIDIFDNQNTKYVYIAVYNTAPEMLGNPNFQSGDLRDHIYMSLPTDKQDYRIPVQPQIKDVTYGFDEMDPEVEKTILNGNGYAKFEKLRYVNIYRNKYNYEITSDSFFSEAGAETFDIAEIPTAVLYGVEYKAELESVYRLPEIANDEEYAGYGPSGTVNETILAPDTGAKLYTHEETEVGVHNYAIYGVNWFYRASTPSADTTTDETTFPDYFSIKPPHNVNGHYIQKEENRLFTTVIEQDELAQREISNPSGDNSFTRITFEWNHVQRIAYQKANKLEFYYRDALPKIIQGEIESTQSLLAGTEINIYTKPFTLGSQDISSTVTPVISPADYPKYIGSWFVSQSERYAILSITSGTNGPVFKVEPIIQPSKIEDPKKRSRFRSSPKKIGPPAGAHFQIVENLSNDSNWTKLDKTIELFSHSDYSETETINGKTITLHIGGIVGTATIETDPTSPSVDGLYKISFDTAVLADHPQKITENVTWYKGTARITNGTEKKVLDIWAIETQNPLIIWAYDPEYAANPITTGTAIDVNFHPGYKVYLDNEPLNGFDKTTLLPAAEENKKESILALRAIDDTFPIAEKSNISIPAVLIGINKREPIKPQKPLGPAFATRPDTFGKSSYTFDVDITEGDPFSLAFYRASDFEILSAIYEPEDIVQIYDDIAALETNAYNLERFNDLANVIFDDDINHLGEFKEYDGYRLPNTFRTDVLNGATTIEDITAVLKMTIDNIFTPLTAQPVVYSFVKEASGIIQTLNIPPIIRNEKGQLLNADAPTFNPFPNTVKYTESSIDKLRFTDYSLDGAAIGTYFYFAREISREMIIGQRSDVLGPIRLVNAFPADAPFIRKVETVLADPISEISAGVRFYINPYHPDENVKKVAIYRTTDVNQSKSIHLMQKAAEVDITDYADGVTDVFADLDYPLFNETIYYRVVALRSIINELDVEEFIPSQPSNVVEGRVVDNINPPAPEVTYLIGSYPSSPPKIANINLTWEPTTYNGKYYLYKMTSSGNWQKVYEVASNQSMSYTVAELDIVDDDGDKIYHRYKVDTENANGLLSLDEKPVVISGPAWSQDGLKMMFWDGYPSSYPGTGNIITDLSGNGVNGTLHNFATPGTAMSGYYNGLLNYDGNNDYISFPNSWMSGITEFSWHFVVKLDSVPNSHNQTTMSFWGYLPGTYIRFTIAGAGYTVSPFINGNTNDFFMYFVQGNQTSVVFNDFSKFYQVTICVKPGEIRTYFDGILNHVAAIDIGTLQYIPNNIGRYGDAESWKGQIPVVMGYNRVLTEQEISQIYEYFKIHINPATPKISFSIGNYAISPERITDIELSWEPTTKDGKYTLYKLISSSNWQKVYEVVSNTSMSYIIAELETEDSNGDTLVHTYKVDAENVDGLLNLDKKPIEISGPAWSQDSLKMMYWDASPSCYPGTGTVVTDLSGNGNNAALAGVAFPGTATSGYYNNSFHFDGDNDQMPFNNAWLLNKTEFSFYTIFKAENLPNAHGQYNLGILGPDSGGSSLNLDRIGVGYIPHLTLFGSLTNYSIESQNGNVVSKFFTDLSKFYHVAFTVKAGEIKLYINGELINNSNVSIGYLTSPLKRIGQYGSVQQWKGQIPLVMGYDRVITSQEVTQIYNYFKGGYS